MPVIELSAIVAVFAIGMWAAHGAEVALARKDPGVVVIDEVLGMLITLALLPVSLPASRRVPVLSRARCLQAVSRGATRTSPRRLGIMVDDAVAGLYAHIALRACMWMVPAWLTA